MDGHSTIDDCVYIADSSARSSSWTPCTGGTSICDLYNVEDTYHGHAGWNSEEMARENCNAWSDCVGYWEQSNGKYWAMNADNADLKAVWMSKKAKVGGVPTLYSEAFADKWPAYIYPAGDLSFSVGVYCGCATLCVCILTYRRWKYGGELGGPGNKQVAAALVLLWATYIGLSAWRVYS